MTPRIHFAICLAAALVIAACLGVQMAPFFKLTAEPSASLITINVVLLVTGILVVHRTVRVLVNRALVAEHTMLRTWADAAVRIRAGGAP